MSTQITFTRQDLIFEAREICIHLRRHRAACYSPDKATGLYDRIMRLIPLPKKEIHEVADTALNFTVGPGGMPLEPGCDMRNATNFLIEYLTICYL